MRSVTRAALIGRREDLAALETLLAGAAQGSPAAAIVEGEAGIGKSTLVAELARRVPPATRVLWGTCTPAGGREMPFAPWTAVLDALADETGSSPKAEPVATPGQVLASFSRTLLTAARDRPTVVIVEDVHWADESSLALLDYLVRVVRGERLLVVATVRTDDPAYELVRRPLRELLRVPHVTGLRPPRFERSEVARQLEALTGVPPTDAATDEAARLSAGVPFFVEELAAAGVADGPVSTSFAADVVGHRIAGLSEPARNLVELAAVGADTLDLGGVFAASGFGDDEFDDALEEAVRAGVLRTEPGIGRVGFRHALLREAALIQAAPRRLTHWHRRCAEVLSSSRSSMPGTDAALARHWRASGEPELALPAALRAAEVARAVCAMAERLRHLEAAIAMWTEVPDAEALTGTDLISLVADAAEAAYQAGKRDETWQLITQARALTSDQDGHPSRCGIELLACWARWQDNEIVSTEEIRRIYESVPAVPLGGLRAEAASTYSVALLHDGSPEAALPVASEALEIATRLHDRAARCKALGRLAITHAALHHAEAALHYAAEEIVAADDLGDLHARNEALMTQGVVLWELGDEEASLEVAMRAQEMLGGDRPGPLPTDWGIHTLNGVEGLLALGRWDQALDQICLVEGSADMTPWLRGWADRLRVWVAVCRGEIGAHELAPDAQAHLVRDNRLQDAVPTVAAFTDALALVGRVDEAREYARPLLHQQRLEHAPPAMVWPLLTVLAEVEADEAPRCDPAMVDRISLLAAATTASSPRDRAYAATVRADLAVARGVPSPELCVHAVACWEPLGMPYFLAWALRRLGVVAAAAGESDRARDAFARALEVADRLGARPFSDRVRRDATASSIRLGTRSAGTSRGSDGALTARELEVLALLADGASNREVADRLFISVKTVSVHVSNLMAKLDATSRGQAVAHARQLGLLVAP